MEESEPALEEDLLMSGILKGVGWTQKLGKS
jgi:hypothetical protein